MRTISEIIVHTTATRPEWMATRPVADKVAEIRRWHVDGNGWNDIGYHYLIDRNGAIAAGRPLERVGAHVKGRNAQSIGIALVGGHGGSETNTFTDHYTQAQDAALRGLIGELKARFGDLAVTGHNQYSAKACPCFYVPTWFEGGGVSRKFVSQEAEKVIQDADKGAGSKTNWAAVLTAGAGAWQGVQAVDWRVQLAALAVVAFALFIFAERIRKSRLAKRAKAELGL
jgi:N-acetyl-anhydromuramyl-L-alanine amidase AmpD